MQAYIHKICSISPWVIPLTREGVGLYYVLSCCTYLIVCSKFDLKGVVAQLENHLLTLQHDIHGQEGACVTVLVSLLTSMQVLQKSLHAQRLGKTARWVGGWVRE